jgi:AbrB family looped-hinge helix DNA binding protein
MDAAARLTSKGQITIPAEVRKVLNLRTGDQLLFKVLKSDREPGFKIEVSRAPDLFELAGSVPTPPHIKDKSWAEIREMAWAAHAWDRERRWIARDAPPDGDDQTER